MWEARDEGMEDSHKRGQHGRDPELGIYFMIKKFWKLQRERIFIYVV